MADTYDVSPADVAAELPGLFPGGFSASTKPSDALVASWITTADTVVALKVQDITGAIPAITDRAAVIAKRYIIEWVKGQVIRAVYVGKDVVVVTAAASAYENNAKFLIDALIEMGSQIVGEGEPGNRVRVAYETPQRGLLITDAQLDSDESYRERRF